MYADDLYELWREAARIDRSLTGFKRHWGSLLRRQLKSHSYSRQMLFSHMAAGKSLLATGVPVPVFGEESLGKRRAVVNALTEGFSAKEKATVRCGPSGSERMLEVRELIRRWSDGRARVSVTDLHIRSTNVLHYINCNALSDFNLLPTASHEVAKEEMLTFVMSSTGTFTDSHTDDPDGSNHCFVGRKLWIVWDTFGGMKRGLDDVERSHVVAKQAAFSISNFLSVPGARWFFIEPGQTLFLPGNMAHKVITLEPYLGVGSFFVMLPSYLRSLERWTSHTALWALDLPKERQMDQVNEITRHVSTKVRSLLKSSVDEQRYWGLDYLSKAVSERTSERSTIRRRALWANSEARSLIETLKGMPALSGQSNMFG